jgi:hypothetical protein
MMPGEPFTNQADAACFDGVVPAAISRSCYGMRKPAISAKRSHQTTAAVIDIFFIGIVLKVLACPCMQLLT